MRWGRGTTVMNPGGREGLEEEVAASRVLEKLGKCY